jgi:hypothetical protein
MASRLGANAIAKISTSYELLSPEDSLQALDLAIRSEIPQIAIFRKYVPKSDRDVPQTLRSSCMFSFLVSHF